MAPKKRAKKSPALLHRGGPKTKVIRGKRHRNLGISPLKTVANKRARDATYGTQKAVVVPLKLKKTVTERVYGVFARKTQPKRRSDYGNFSVRHVRVD